jgi:hypothetical protein
MEKLVNKTVELELVGLEGNAFNLMGVFGAAAKEQGWTKEEVDLVLEEAMSSDFDHLLQTLIVHCH